MNVDAENGGVSGEENGNVEDVEVALRVGWNVNDGHAESEEVDVPGGSGAGVGVCGIGGA